MLGKRTSLGIEVNGEHIRVVELRSHADGYEVLQATCLNAVQGDISTALKHFIFEAGIAPGRIVCSLPTEACALKLVELPRAAGAELSGMIRYEAELQMPLPLDDMSWGYRSCHDMATETGHPVLIAGVRCEEAEAITAAMEAAHLEPDILSFAMAAAVRSVGGTDDDSPVMILDIGRAWINIGIARQGCLVYSRCIKSNGERESAVDVWLNRIAAEMKRSVFALAAGGSPIPVKAVMLSEDAAVYGLCGALSELSGLDTAPGRPWSGMKVAETAAGAGAADFAVATGLALMGLDDGGYINLLPGNRLEERTARRRDGLLLSGLGAAALLLAVMLISGQGALSSTAAELRDAKTGLQEARQAMRAVASARGVSAADLRRQIDGIRNRGKSPLEMLRLLSLQMPPGIWLTELSYVKDKSLTVTGKGNTNPAIAAAVDRLAATGLFDSVTLDYSNREQADAKTQGGVKVGSSLPEDSGLAGYDFRITCSWQQKKGTLQPGKRADDDRKTGITVQ